jgi:hypothetical protein
VCARSPRSGVGVELVWRHVERLELERLEPVGLVVERFQLVRQRLAMATWG